MCDYDFRNDYLNKISTVDFETLFGDTFSIGFIILKLQYLRPVLISIFCRSRSFCLSEYNATMAHVTPKLSTTERSLARALPRHDPTALSALALHRK